MGVPEEVGGGGQNDKDTFYFFVFMTKLHTHNDRTSDVMLTRRVTRQD